MSVFIENFEHLEKHIKQFLEDQNLSNPKFDMFIANKEGENYLGVIYRVTIEGTKNGEIIKLNLIIKHVTQEKEERQFYLNEIQFYEVVLPIFIDLTREFNMTINDIPTFYGGCKNPENEMIVLEDLSCRGFRIKDSMMLDFPHASLALQHLGRFHAYSFALRDKNPEKLKNMSSIKGAFFGEHQNFKREYISKICDVAIRAIANEGEKYVIRMNEFKKNIEQIIDYTLDDRNVEPYAVLNHGDFWTNNMLFKYNDVGQPEEMCMIDFQIIRYGSPVMDLSFMLFTCCPPKLREKHYDELLYQYHHSLAQCLKEFGSDVEKLFPFEKLLDHLHRFGSYGACLALLVLHFFTRQEGEFPQNIENDEHRNILTRQLDTNELYSNMMRGTFKDMIDRNYI